MDRPEAQLKKHLDCLDGIGNVEASTPNILNLTESKTLILFGGTSRRGPTSSQAIFAYDFQQYDRILVILESRILDVSTTPIEVYADGLSIENIQTVAKNIEDILHGRQTPQKLTTMEDSLITELQEADLLTYPTPSNAVELLINWTITDQRSKILNPGCGTGQLLVKIRDQITDEDEDNTNHSLWGIDNNPIAAEIAKNRLTGDETILRTDFLDFTDNRRQSSLDELHSLPDETQSVPKFEAVISHPPVVRSRNLPKEVRETILERFEGCSRLDQAFLIYSLTLLEDGGRGAFYIPQSSLTEDFLETLQSKGQIHAMARISTAENFTQGIQPVLLFYEKTCSPGGENHQIRLIHLDKSEISPLDKSLLHGPIGEALDRAKGIDDISMAAVSQDEIVPDLLHLALISPNASPFLFSDTFEGLATVAQPRTGLKTGANQFFYFDGEEKASSEIPDEFFTPVLRKLSPNNNRVTKEDISWYLLDLREIVEKAKNHITSDKDFGDWLTEQGYPYLADYIIESRLQFEEDSDGLDTWIPTGFTERVENPDLVTQGIFSIEEPDKPDWWLVDIEDEVVFDSTVVGIHVQEETPPIALWALLNTPLYKRIQKDSMPPLHNDPNYSQFRIGKLKAIPIIESLLNDTFANTVESLLPAESAHEEITIRNRIIETCSPNEREAVDAAFNAFSQQALQWFLSGNELRILGEKIEKKSNPQEFLLEQFGDDVLVDVENTFSRVTLFEGRREVLLDLINLFKNNSYQTFLIGLASQFEGVLVDFVEETGGHIESEVREIEQDGEKKEIKVLVFYRPGRQGGKKKDLKRLFDEFFEGEYLNFLQQTVRERRNELAHGTLVEDPEEKAVVLLVAFFGMSNNILHRYNQYLARSGR